MIGAISNAVSGILGATQKVDAAAKNVAQGPSENNDFIEDIIDIKIAETQFKANIETLKVVDELTEDLFRIVDEDV